jgi:hypothetical protein
MTLLWASILLLILFFASRRKSRRRRRAAVGRDVILHPYGDEAPLPVSIIRHYARPMTPVWASILPWILFFASRRNNRRQRQAAVGPHVILHPYADKAPLRISIIRENIAPVRGLVALAADHPASIPAILGNKKVPTPGGPSKRPGRTRRRRRR